jgi:uncharacterized membrane protein
MESEQLVQELSVEDRVLVVFGYLGPLALVTLIASRREFVKWQAKQGIILTAALIALYTLLKFVQFVLDRYLWAIFGEMFRAGLWLVVLGVAVMTLVCIVRGLEGERFKIPMIGDLADRL